ncbi:hypothetical protein BUALT_Bualt06G0057000 [Buddleja alternifolia]|uniref:Protein yippee-like n=1 Tax=Buddleja alternifolia TaxID=168488 RepID=A0AAV6XNX5_9LAMI|nr:hypothetical protein BUALT_Bualt06G0057000 [Buddleja alternifolia]
MGRVFAVTLEGKIYSCKHCGTHLSTTDDIVSKAFHCSHGKAYLFSKVMMMTGMHTVADIFCVRCGLIVGWKYEAAHEKGQKYKEGKSVLERYKICGPNGSCYWVRHGGGSDSDDV